MDLLAGSRRIAFFGGSFDPPHLGHLAVARAARDALRLETVLFAPVGAQPLKPAGSVASFSDRLAMTELAISGEHGFAVSMADAPSAIGQPNYTIDTLLRIRAGLEADRLLLCLMGADSFAGLRSWRRGAEIPFVAPLIIASRPGEEIADLTAALPQGLTMEPAACGADSAGAPDLACFAVRNAAGLSAPLFLLPGLQIEISASDVRKRVPSEGDGRSLLSPAVADYIRAHELYR